MLTFGMQGPSFTGGLFTTDIFRHVLDEHGRDNLASLVAWFIISKHFGRGEYQVSHRMGYFAIPTGIIPPGQSSEGLSNWVGDHDVTDQPLLLCFVVKECSLQR